MPWNLLIFPLAAAYYVLTRSYLFKFRQQRLDRQRLIFESVLLGTFISFVAFLFRFLIEYVKPEFIEYLSDEFPFKQSFTITSLSTLGLSWLFVKISNVFFDKKKFLGKSIKRLGNELEIILKASFDKNKLLQLTLNSGKVYVGWVKELPIPSVSNYVRIIPAISGYRTNKTNEIVFTSQYLKVYSEYIEEGRIVNLNDLSSDLILDLNCVIGVSFFDLEMYERFNKLKNNDE